MATEPAVAAAGAGLGISGAPADAALDAARAAVARAGTERADLALVFVSGDAYAAGFLYAYTQGRDLATCGRLGGAMAAKVISHFGPRSEVSDIKKVAASVL